MGSYRVQIKWPVFMCNLEVDCVISAHLGECVTGDRNKQSDLLTQPFKAE